MAIVETLEGYQPACNDCGIFLCFYLDNAEYERTKEFWEQWRCQYCDPHVIGSFARWLQSKNESHEFLDNSGPV